MLSDVAEKNSIKNVLKWFFCGFSFFFIAMLFFFTSYFEFGLKRR